MSLPIREHGMGCGAGGVLEVGHVGSIDARMWVCTVCWRCIRVELARGWPLATRWAASAVQVDRAWRERELAALVGRCFAEQLGDLGLVEGVEAAVEGHDRARAPEPRLGRGAEAA